MGRLFDAVLFMFVLIVLGRLYDMEERRQWRDWIDSKGPTDDFDRDFDFDRKYDSYRDFDQDFDRDD